ncbi:peptidase family C54-domain-containing protein [Mycena olivaceomarginata]|nr:peptidase family C54-domain-containing protein [Mycena olivaceomarginata]
MPASGSALPSSGTAKRPSGRHSAAGASLAPIVPASTSGTLKSSALPLSPTSPTTPASKLPRFLQSPAARDRSKSLSIDRPPSAASSSASHTSNISNSTSTSSASGRRSATRFLGIGKDKDKEKERERQRIRQVERGAPSAEELLALHESASAYEDGESAPPGSPPSAFSTARPRTRSERHFSASTPPSSAHSHSGSSNGHGDLTLARTPSRLGVDASGVGARLSGWFAHLAGSTSDLSLAATISGSLSHAGNTAAALASSTSSKSAPTTTSHKHKGEATPGKAGAGKTLLDKAVRYLLDGDAAPDRSTEDIWLMGVRLPGWGPEDEQRVALAAAHPHASSVSGKEKDPAHHALGTSKRRSGSKTRGTAAASSPTSHASASPTSPTLSSPSDDDPEGYDPDAAPPDPGPWPAAFHAAFYAHVWCTYRAGFDPIRDLPSLASLPPPLFFPGAPPPPSSQSASSLSHSGSTAVPTSPGGMRHSPAQSDSSAYSSGSSRGGHGGARHSQVSSASSATGSYANSSWNGGYAASTTSSNSSATKKKWWPLGGTKGWTSDTGWGCMLRTSQSLLATAVGRVGEPPLHPTPPVPFPPRSRAAHALHARLLSWFLDAPAAPFGVHRMALAGKAAGKDVGMWFGPSAAAGALRMLVDAFPACGLGVSVATDGTLYQTEVFAASHSPSSASAQSGSSLSATSVSSHGHGSSRGHGSSHGHARGKDTKQQRWGDRPVLLLLGIRLGLDGVNPIYYETIKALYTFPQSVGIAGGRPSSSYYFVGVQGDGLFYLDPHHSRPSVPLRPFMGDPQPPLSAPASSHGHRTTSPPSSHGHHAHAHDHGRRSLSPEAAAYGRGGSMSPESSGFARGGSMSPDFAYARGGSMSPDWGGQTPMTEDELVIVRPGSRRSHDSHDKAGGGHPAGGSMSAAEEAHFARAYSAAEMRTFHCERVRKMPLSGLDPSMLIGFMVRDEAEWVDLRRRIKELPRTIFAIADEPPTWPGADDDDDMGLESISDPEEVEELGDDGDISTTSHAPSSSASHAAGSGFSHTHAHHGSNSTTHSASTGSSSARSEEVDTEEDPVAPITPLPNARFDLSGAPPQPPAKDKRTVGDAYAELEEEDSFVDAAEEVDIEDDWVDPVAPPPPPVVKKDKDKGSSGSGKSKSKSKAKGSKKAVPVPVPSVHYPFPVSSEDTGGAGSGAGRERTATVVPRGTGATGAGAGASTGAGAGGGGQRMHTARARDGGRTQSGGVRGVLTED